MTEVAFHFNAPDKWAYACRLLRTIANASPAPTTKLHETSSNVRRRPSDDCSIHELSGRRLRACRYQRSHRTQPG